MCLKGKWWITRSTLVREIQTTATLIFVTSRTPTCLVQISSASSSNHYLSPPLQLLVDEPRKPPYEWIVGSAIIELRDNKNVSPTSMGFLFHLRIQYFESLVCSQLRWTLTPRTQSRHWGRPRRRFGFVVRVWSHSVSLGWRRLHSRPSHRALPPQQGRHWLYSIGARSARLDKKTQSR